MQLLAATLFVLATAGGVHAFLDAFMHQGHGGADDDVAGGFLDDGKRLENRHAAADQGAQRARESGDGHLADDRAEDRHVELELVKYPPPKTGADERHKAGHKHGDANGGDDEVVGDGVADGEDELGEAGKILARHHVLEDVLELRHHPNHQHGENDHGHREHRDRIEHGGDDLALNLLGFLHELGEPGENDFEHTAQFVCLDHVYEKAVEHLRMLRQRFGEGAASFDAGAEFVDDLFEGRMPFLLFQDAQAAEQGQAGV